MQKEFQASLSVIHVMRHIDAAGSAEVERAAREEIERLQTSAGVQAGLLVIGRGSAGGLFGRLRINSCAIIRQSPRHTTGENASPQFTPSPAWPRPTG